ncbi:MAG: DR2241 family protein [Halorientalis sp.]
MTETAVDHLVEAAADGVDLDGLRATRTDAGYAFATPATERDGLSEAAFRRVAAEHAPHVTNWYFWTELVPDRADYRAFLRWLERADVQSVPERHDALATGVTREWGQLRLTARDAGDGRRRYEVRHEADRDADAADLERHDDPLDARDVVTYDDRGRYRPLKTAPTLPAGWVFPDLGPAELARTVEYVYPATITNWHREREGELDVSHWRETIDRQTGIYSVVQTWNRQEGHEHVNWVAEACCDDSQCLKRREWEYDEETDLDVPGGAGEFPCREPCSLVVAAARTWTKLEGEQPRTYEFELTPSEKEQLEAIVDAVADGTADEIREADVRDGANRYRARFLRAKLFDDEGNLGGVPTERSDEAED